MSTLNHSIQPSISILGVHISAITRREVLATIEQFIEQKAKRMIVTPNPEQVMMAQKDERFRTILNEASLALCDGVGLVWASRLLTGSGPVILGRVTGEEIMNSLIDSAKENGWRVMLVGGKVGVAQEAAKKLQYDLKGSEPLRIMAQIKGIEGHWDIRDYSEEENERIVRQINRFKPDLLFVGYGAPWQEKWLYDNLKQLDIKVGMVVGGAIDMIVDPSLKPPQFMTRLGLDWMYRLVRQPWRLKRQLDLLRFGFLIFRSRLTLH